MLAVNKAHQSELTMDISFKCPNCDQELEVDASGAGSTIECPSCSNSITVPSADPSTVVHVAAFAPAPPEPLEPPKEEKHFSVPVHEHAPAQELIKKPNRPLEVIAKEGDKTMRIKTFKRTDCVEVGKDRFDEFVSAFLEKIGQTNIVSINPISYSYMELGSRQIMGDYGVMIVFKG
jgi:DNA-directed RNA polymerase subunit RPC12/RpoP